MSKHTPGKWIADFDDIVVRRDDGTKQLIGRTYPADGETDGSELGPEQMANTQLFAAAPELLAALEDLTALVRGECPALLNEDSGGDARLVMEIDEAITKARGES